MSKEFSHILTLAHDLSRSEQLKLIQAVAAIVEIDEANMGEEVKRNWEAEIERRLELFETGEMQARPWREVMEELRT